MKSNKKIQPKQNINLGDKVYCKIIEIRKNKNYLSYIVKFSLTYLELIKFLDFYGNMPLPSYIKKKDYSINPTIKIIRQFLLIGLEQLLRQLQVYISQKIDK